MALRLSPLFLAAAFLFAGCGGGGGTTPVALTTTAPSGTPTSAPPTAPTNAPTTVPLSLRTIGGAPLTATASQLSVVKRSAQAKTQAQGVTNGLPILVESSGMVAAWSGNFFTWASNVANATDVPETGLTITASGTLAVSNPGPTANTCLGQVSAVCVVHPTAWEWGTSATNGKPVGAQTLTVAFSDGTTAQTHDYVYDGWNLPCNAGWVYQNNALVPTVTKAASDVYADCVNGNIDFPMGGLVWAQPAADQYGNTATIMPTLTAQPVIAVLNSVVPMTAIPDGMVFAIQTHDGGFAKVYFDSTPGTGATNAGQGMSLHSQTNGAFPF